MLLSAQTLPALTMLSWALLTLYIWAALGQWIITRPMKFERDTFCFGCLVSGYIAWHAEVWLGVNPNDLCLCSSCHASLSFTYSTAQGKLKSLQRFIRERTQNIEEFHITFQLELETQRLIRTKCICKWRRKAGGDVLTGNTHHDQLKRGSSSSVPWFQLTVSMWK